MNASTLLVRMFEDGFDVSLAANDALLLRPASRLTDEHRTLLRAHKAEIVNLLHSTRETTQHLLAAAMRCCDHHRDGEPARQQMHAEVMTTPWHLRDDLLGYFDQSYPATVKNKAI